MRRLSPTGLARRTAALATALLAVLLLGLGPGGAPAADEEPGRLSRVGLGAYRWIAQNTEPGSRILASAYTDGSLAVLSERDGIIDGRAPYLEGRAFLAEATDHILGAREVFRSPMSPPARAFLRRVEPDYLLVAGPRPRVDTLGGYRPFPVDLRALRRAPYLEAVRSFGEGLHLFRVDRASLAVARQPGHGRGA